VYEWGLRQRGLAASRWGVGPDLPRGGVVPRFSVSYIYFLRKYPPHDTAQTRAPPPSYELALAWVGGWVVCRYDTGEGVRFPRGWVGGWLGGWGVSRR
jgi:hypothetical protein